MRSLRLRDCCAVWSESVTQVGESSQETRRTLDDTAGRPRKSQPIERGSTERSHMPKRWTAFPSRLFSFSGDVAVEMIENDAHGV